VYVKTSSLLPTAAQNFTLGQDTEPSPSSPLLPTLVGPDQVFPLKVKALPPQVTAMQNVADGQETESGPSP
jgi:hypothetical protein